MTIRESLSLPFDGIFHPHLTTIKDSYIITLLESTHGW